MPELVVQIVTHNNEATIQETLDSLKPLDAEIWLLDHNSNDKTLAIAKDQCNIKKITQRSEGRNATTGDWTLNVEPWERITGHSVILDAISSNSGAYRVFISQGDILTKQLRLWHKSTGITFTGHIYESLQPEVQAATINALFVSNLVDQSEYNLKILHNWQRIAPMTATPYYYEAMIHLANSRYDDFIRKADHFLFMSNTMSMSVIMTRYYLALTYCLVKRNSHDSMKNLIVCLSLKPIMAEFWCLLGDIHYFIEHDFDKAYRFYDNAIILGSKRKVGDEWPVQLSKYSEYPQQMMDSCKAIKEKRKIITG